MTFGSACATAIAPTDARLKNLSVVFSQYWPPSIVFHTPPPVEPKYKVLRSRGSPATAPTRPPRYGPALRHSSRSKKLGVSRGAAVARRAAVAVRRFAGMSCLPRYASVAIENLVLLATLCPA